MSNRFLALSTQDRKLAFDNAALSLHLNAVILEKDFWVSWLLGLLFAQPELAPFLVFKGGTSLSKVFGVIDRFSEDIDLCLVPEFVGADASGFDALTSRVKRDAAVLEMQRLCADKVQQVLLPLLEGAIPTPWTPRLQANGCITMWMPSRLFCTFAIPRRRGMALTTCAAKSNWRWVR